MSAGGGGASDGGGGPGAGTSPAASSRLPYPQRFHAAVSFVEGCLAAATSSDGGGGSNGGDNAPAAAATSNGGHGDGPLPPPATSRLSDEAKLLFYALGKQATEGPCTQPKPWGWDVVASAKWQSWSQLGQMGKLEAMRLYVKTLEEEHPEWLAEAGDAAAGLLSSAPSAGGNGNGTGGDGGNGTTKPAAVSSLPPPPPDSSPSPEAPPTSIVTSLRDACVPGRWVALQLPDGARRPSARFEHAAALMGGRLFVVGGHLRGGRALADVWVFDLERLAWTPLWSGGGGNSSGSNNGASPALVGHTVTAYRGKLVVVGGHPRLERAASSGAVDEAEAAAAAAAADLPRPRPRNRAEAAGDTEVWVFDPAEQSWTHLRPAAPFASAPCARGAHTAVALGVGGSELHVYGGEDASRRPLGDLWVLDLDAATDADSDGGPDGPVANWRRVEPSPDGGARPAAADGGGGARPRVGGGGDDDSSSSEEPAAAAAAAPLLLGARRNSRPAPAPLEPPPRSAHAAAAYQGRYMAVYGGAAMGSGCHADTWLYDRETGCWAQAAEHGAVPGARAGHAGARLGEAWFVLGGGDHVRGCRDVLAADLTQLPAGAITWTRVSTVPVRSPLSSEGGSLTAVPALGALLAFGGYNGRCHDSLSLYSARKEMIDPLSTGVEEAGGGGGGGVAGAAEAAEGAAAAAAAAAAADDEAPLLSSLGRAVSALFGSASSLKPPGGEGEQQEKQQQEKQQQPAPQRSPSPPLEALNDDATAALKPRTPHEQALLRDLAVQREVLRRELRSAREELAEAKREREVEVAALKRALADAHRQLGEEQRRREALEKRLGASGKGEEEGVVVAGGKDEAAAEEEEARRLREEEAEARASAAAVAGGGGVWGLFASVPSSSAPPAPSSARG
jgi:acyl-CoA-binding protein